ncbi:hypothetical protein ALC56_03141, partial [Trachymyrmex septentrionalis]
RRAIYPPEGALSRFIGAWLRGPLIVGTASCPCRMSWRAKFEGPQDLLGPPRRRRQSAKIVGIASFYNSRYGKAQKGNEHGNAKRVKHANNVAKKRRCVRPLKCRRTQDASLHYWAGSCDPCNEWKTLRHNFQLMSYYFQPNLIFVLQLLKNFAFGANRCIHLFKMYSVL